MELELRSVELQGAHEAGGAPRRVGRAPTLVDRWSPLMWIFLPVFYIYSKIILH